MLTACVDRGRTRTSGRMLGAPSLPSRTAARRRGPRTSCSASSRGWCVMPTARGFGSGSTPSGCSAGRDQSRTRGTGRTWCSLLLLAWTESSRVEGCSTPESSRWSWVLKVMSCRSRPGGRTRSSRWRRRFACRNPGRTDVSSRKTWWLVWWTRGRIGKDGEVGFVCSSSGRSEASWVTTGEAGMEARWCVVWLTVEVSRSGVVLQVVGERVGS